MRSHSFGRITFLGSIVVVALLLSSTGTVRAQEHPEHPTTGNSEKLKPDTITVDQMAQAITNYVNTDTKLKGGYFFVFDSVAKKPLSLNLVKVHKDRVSKVGDNLYFACSDFQESSGKMYDLDFFMKSVDGNLEVTDVMIHKEDGKPRYQWYEEDGVWKRRSDS